MIFFIIFIIVKNKGANNIKLLFKNGVDFYGFVGDNKARYMIISDLKLFSFNHSLNMGE